ncbi:1-acyl-sn-glycerol-3-phosphate acyltransferase [Xylanibacter caecicola]|uniref:1-acyl-sn-glycerol-3-phosphate acyltransferase n=1 Tax=Xylanibacter caecicola TaxID=2736294 RepID=UPI0025909C86|nr:1-acyl-sn-glycerol-3-phosphate acyltransferase [Xylanibacter caecicola]
MEHNSCNAGCDLSKFDGIRPFNPEELSAVYERLLEDTQFRQVIAYILPGAPLEAVRQKMMACRTNLDFQFAFCYDFLNGLLKKTSAGIDMDRAAIDKKKRYTFVSNHRDIVLDSAFLDKLLIDAGFDTTCEIAIGDNLLSLPWVKDLVRVNKSFIVRRGLSPRETLAASRTLSEYMHFVINEKNDNIWIAQREGRAKDSNDRTQPAILKMMAMGGQGSVVERLAGLHIVPLSISYEYDPCDFLKAAEFQLKRDVEGWKKSAHDDVVSMQTGIMGYKGRIHYHCSPCIDDYLYGEAAGLPKTDVFDAVAAHIDKEIHRNYCLFPINYVALDMLGGTALHNDKYTLEDKAVFEQYLAGQMAKIDIPNKDESFLYERMLTMYANPAVNYLSAIERA